MVHKFVQTFILLISTMLLSACTGFSAYQPSMTKPDAFTLTLVTPQDSAVQLTWAHSANAARYVVNYGTTSQVYTQSVTGLFLETALIGSLTNGVTYYFSVKAENDAGQTIATNELQATPNLPVFTLVDTTTIASHLAWSESRQITISGVGPENCSDLLTAQSSNASVIDQANIVISGTSPNCTLTWPMAAHANGLTAITVSAYQGADRVTHTFNYKALPQGSAIYALRKVVSGYLGSAVQVRRSSDNLTQDIGFDLNGDLDLTALNLFVGSNSAFIQKWYDQSGNAQNLSQTSLSNQPRIVNSGVIDAQGGKPSVYFSNTTALVGGTNFPVGSDYTESFIANQTSHGDYGILVCSSVTFGAGMHAMIFAGTDYQSIYQNAINSSSTATALNTLNILTHVFNDSAMTVQFSTNGQSSGTSAVGTKVSDSSFEIGGGFGSYGGLIGYISEGYIFPSAYSLTDQLSLHQFEGSYFGITTP